MLNDKDVQGVYESYISAIQKIKNVSHRVVPRQPDDHHETETLVDRMQGDGGNGDPRNQNNSTSDTDSIEDNNDLQLTDTATQTPPTPIAILTLSTNTDNEHNDMIKTDLYSIASNAKKLYDLACQGHTFDPWMFSKISICSDSLGNITKVAEYDSVMNQ